MSKVKEVELAGVSGTTEKPLDRGELPESVVWVADSAEVGDDPEALAERLRALQGDPEGVPLRVHFSGNGTRPDLEQNVLVEVMQVMVEDGRVVVELRERPGNASGL